jgi:MFS family permease
LLAVLLSTTGLGLSYGVGYTVTAVRFEAWGQPGWVVGLAGSAPSLAVIALVPSAPRLAARLGTVRAMTAGAALVALSFALMPVLETAGWWLVLRFVSGLGLTLPWLVGETWINTVAGESSRGRVLATYTVLLFGGWAVGPVVLAVVGTAGAAPFVVGVLAIVAVVAPLLAVRRLAPPVEDPGRVSLRAALGLAPLGGLAALVGGMVEFGYISLLPLYAVSAGVAEGAALRLLTVLLVGGVVLQLAVGALADRVDRSLVLAGLGLTLAGAATGFAVVVTSPGWGAVAAVVLGGVVMGFYSVGLALLGSRVPRERLVVANAGFLLAYETGAVVGPVLGGVAIDVWKPHGLAVLAAAVGVLFRGRGPRAPLHGRASQPSSTLRARSPAGRAAYRSWLWRGARRQALGGNGRRRLDWSGSRGAPRGPTDNDVRKALP